MMGRGTMAIHIDRVRGADIRAIADIERESFSDPWSERSFHDILSHAGIYFLCARSRDERSAGGASELVGYVVAWFAAGEGEIANLAVASGARRIGIGSALLDATLDAARAAGVTDIYLEVRTSNVRARQLYDSRGFVEVGRRHSYYRRPVEDAVILRRTEPALADKVKSEV
jgi:ribosomal-protein-alanine N-acetyltransferase